jgi:hypothetical protein
VSSSVSTVLHSGLPLVGHYKHDAGNGIWVSMNKRSLRLHAANRPQTAARNRPLSGRCTTAPRLGLTEELERGDGGETPPHFYRDRIGGARSHRRSPQTRSRPRLRAASSVTDRNRAALERLPGTQEAS